MMGKLEPVAAPLGSWRTEGQLRQAPCLHFAISLADYPFFADNLQPRKGKLLVAYEIHC